MRGENIIAGGAVALLGLALAACLGIGNDPPKVAVEIVGEPTWTNGIEALLDYYCVECHGPQPQDASLSWFRVDVYGDEGGRSGAYTLRLRHLARVSDAGRPMPPAPRTTMAPEEVAALRHWIDLGAPYDESDVVAGGGPSCTAGTIGACACPGGYYGQQTCLADGSYAPCECGGEGPGPGGDPPADPVLADVVAWVFAPSCNAAAGCHGAGGAPPRLTGDAGLMQRLLDPSLQVPGLRRILPGNLDQSYLYLKTRASFPTSGVGVGGVMPPPESGLLSPDQAGVLERWITSGAPE